MELTKTTKFLIRPLGIVPKNEHYPEWQIVKRYKFINAYVRDKSHETSIGQPIFLLFRPSNPVGINKFIEEEYEIGLLKEDYDYPDGYVVLLYEFPQEYKRDYDLLLQAKYSQTSKEFKDLFPEERSSRVTKNAKGEVVKIVQRTFQYMVLHKTSELRENIEDLYKVKLDPEDELYSLFDIEKETLKIEDYVQ